MNKSFSPRFFLVLTASILLFIAAHLLESHYEAEFNDSKGAANKAELALNDQEQNINMFFDTLLNQLSSRNLTGLPLDLYLNRTAFELEGFTHFLFDDNRLIYWSNNNVLYTGSISENIQNQSLIFFKNAWYEIFIRKSDNRTLIGLLLIKRQFSFENQYLKNTFNEVLKLPDHALLSTEIANENNFPVYNSNGDFLFSLAFDSQGIYYKPKSISIVLIFIGLLLLFIFLYAFVRHLSWKRPWLAFLIIITIVALRIVCLVLEFPSTLYLAPLFSPTFYASSPILNSLGDLLISSLVFSYIVIFFYQYFNRFNVQSKTKLIRLLRSVHVILVILFTFLYSVFI
ncbi:MAG: hypothetical protein HKN22_02610, partial [Bacteroidia bacterium]|nr:hypothetical protein [Bacteroidia bacterium]